MLASRSRYKVHSPFVFNLINQVLRRKSDYSYLNNYVSQLKKDKSTLKINDFGAGSRKANSDNRKVCDICNTSSSSAKKADLIKRICEYERDEFICLELGTNLGVATKAIASSKKCTKIISLEGCSEIFEYTKDKLKEDQKIELFNSLFDDQLEFLLEQDNPNIVYIDGNHTYEATIRYFNKIAENKQVDLIIFDDINWSEGMLKAWNEIIQDDRFHVSINLFRLGLLYRRDGQRKEDFVIRY